jgi:hypothetical protein
MQMLMDTDFLIFAGSSIAVALATLAARLLRGPPDDDPDD